jgi:signal transduction histidine kinase
MKKHEEESNAQQLEASFSLAGYLLEAQDEGAIILAAMRVGEELLGAEGCTFVPFNEWEQSLPKLKHGEADFLVDPAFLDRLSSPVARHTCRVCQKKQAGAECILLQESTGDERVCCVALRCGGREIGVLNFFFSGPPLVSDSQHRFLGEMVRLTDLALDSMRLHSQEKEALRRGQTTEASRERLISMDVQNAGLLEQLEYRAVLEERGRLAREIHDGLAQTLAFLKMEAARMQGYVAKGEVGSVDRTLQACYRTLSDAYLDARQAIDNLRRVPDEKFTDWLQATVNDFETLTGMTVKLSIKELDYPFPAPVKVQAMRIVQEALTNIRKHAQACAVSIVTVEGEGEVVIEIKDNGRGFSPEDVQTSQYGLRSMRERAESIGADIQVVSAPGVGTTVRLRIPVREKANL